MTVADSSKKYNFIGNSPIYLKHSDVASTRGNILITICSAANRVANNQIFGATQSNGIWTIYIKSLEARVNLLTRGLTIDNHQVKLYDSNPYKRSQGEINEKIIFRGLPLEFENSHILNFLKRYEHIQTRSQIVYARERDERIDSFSPYLNGERYVYVSAEGSENITPALPKDAIIGGYRVQIYHKSQKIWCLRCKNPDKPHNTNDIYNCDAYQPDKDIITIKSRDNVLCNFFECDVKVWDQNFKSSEAAYQWRKCHELLKPELAEEVFKAPHPKDAKSLVRDVFTQNELEIWDTMRLKVMREVLEAKAESNVIFRSTLIHSGTKRLVEATGPNESYWGVGLTPFLAGTTKHEYYPRNSNHLGILLEEIRAKLIQGAAQREQQQIDSFLSVSPLDSTSTYNPIINMAEQSESTMLTLESLAKTFSNAFNATTSTTTSGGGEPQQPVRDAQHKTDGSQLNSTANETPTESQTPSGGKQHTTLKSQLLSTPRHTPCGSRSGTPGSSIPKRPHPSPGSDSSQSDTRTNKKPCTPVVTPQLSPHISTTSPKHAGSATKASSHVT